MIPKSDYDYSSIGLEELPSKTFQIDFTNNMIGNSIDNLEAVKQAILLILSTERYEYLIFDWSYGFETKDLYGLPIGYTYPEIKRRLEEALTQDDRIESVDAFSFDKRKGAVHVTFTVHTIYGEVQTETEVKI
ncbi:MAG TPA: DUF2634 domain-containing protein [Lachnospiraceae bacterium]|nr:DUF2634 domain-containing protein [Lachnospiraceae bacterium]